MLLQILILLRACSGGDGCGHVWKGEEKFGHGRWDEGKVGFSRKLKGGDDTLNSHSKLREEE